MNNKQELHKAMNHLAHGFLWVHSSEGYEYWLEVYNNLLKQGVPETFIPPIDTLFPDIDSCGIFLDALPLAFWWDQSPQGEAYWSEVFCNALKIYNTKTKHSIEIPKTSQVSNTISLRNFSL